jgi:DNA helicase HerA-like ATPase
LGVPMSSATSLPELVPHDFRADANPALPNSLVLVGSIVDYNESPSFNRLACQLEPEIEVKPGQLLAVWHGRRNKKIMTIAQVSDCFERNPSEEPELANARKRLGLGQGYAREGVSTRVFRIAICETMEEFDVEEDQEEWRVVGERAPETLCRAGDPVVLVPIALCQRALGALPNPDGGLDLGTLFGPQPAPITLKSDIAQMHVGVFGNPGKGKSYFSGVLVEELSAWNVPMLILDVNGETIEAARSLGGNCITLPDKSRFGLPLSLLTPSELIDIAPNVQPGTQYAELIELAHDHLRGQSKRSGKDFTFDDLCAEMALRAESLDLKKPTVNTAISRVKALSSNPLIGERFDFVEELKKNRLIVLDCRYLTVEQTRLIAAAAARTLQRHGRTMAQRSLSVDATESEKHWFAVLYIDEAHTVAPANENVVSTQVLYELARMGRHVRTGLILASQSPADLDRSILKRLQTRFVFALERDQLQAIGGISADLGDDLLAALPKLPRGVCAVTGSSEMIRHGFILKVRERKTPVGGSTPPVFSGRTKNKREME